LLYGVADCVDKSGSGERFESILGFMFGIQSKPEFCQC
jgi:hypothetical protein